MTIESQLASFGVETELISALTQNGIDVSWVSEVLRFAKDGEVLMSVPISTNLWNATVKDEHLSAAVQATVKTALAMVDPLTDTVKSVLKDVKAKPVTMKQKPSFAPKVGPLIQKPTPMPNPELTDEQKGLLESPLKGENPTYKTAKVAFRVLSKEQMEKVPAVPLVNAAALLQPVHGSGEGTRYFVVAMNDHVRVAARYKGQTLSVRVEGDLKKVHPLLVELGFKLYPDYASTHLQVGDQKLAARALGAVLAPFEFSLPTIPLSAIIGKGA